MDNYNACGYCLLLLFLRHRYYETYNVQKLYCFVLSPKKINTFMEKFNVKHTHTHTHIFDIAWHFYSLLANSFWPFFWSGIDQKHVFFPYKYNNNIHKSIKERSSYREQKVTLQSNPKVIKLLSVILKLTQTSMCGKPYVTIYMSIFIQNLSKRVIEQFKKIDNST